MLLLQLVALAGMKYPAPHPKHAEPDANEDLPISQVVHVEFDEAPTAAEDVPASQLLQSEDPATGVNFPAMHCVHEEEPGPE
jgi:hypothetical protein